MNQEKLNKKIFRVLSYIIKKENKPQNTVTPIKISYAISLQKINSKPFVIKIYPFLIAFENQMLEVIQ
jgi:hypothetical protein